jgi:hypothetical protein
MPTFKGNRPIQFDLELKKTAFDMDLARPITCMKFICTISVRINKFVADGTVTNFVYADNGDMIAAKVKPEFSLIKPAYYDMQITLNPLADDLNSLAITSISQQAVEMPQGAIVINFRPLLNNESDDAKIQRFAHKARRLRQWHA